MLAALLAAAAAVALLALDVRLAVRQYTLPTGKLDAPVRIALITDFHGCNYGAGQAELLDPLREAQPDLVLLGGDIFDDVLPWDNTLELLELLGAQYPCYYVSGNHEFWSGRAEEMKDALRERGVTVLEGGRTAVEVNGQTISLSGIDDPDAGAAYGGQLEASAPAGEGFSLLLAHRPERIGDYLPYGYDLVLSGHAHGGQWRIPGLLNGLWAPNAGLFPKYAGGLYTHGDTVHVVSRGLARETTRIPRLFNRPELVLVDLVPAR